MVKKIVLTVFFSVFICVFVAFNYLLIQKENTEIDTRELEQEMTAKSATISSQVDKINDLERRAAEMYEQIGSLREGGEEKDAVIFTLEEDAARREELLGNREDLINKLKQGLDVMQVGKQAYEWVSYINNKEYDMAYARFNRAIDSAYVSLILSEFRAYYERQIAMVEVRTIDVMTRGIPEHIDNDLVIAVVVDLITPLSLELFYESLDERSEIARAEAEALAEEEARLAAIREQELLEELAEAEAEAAANALLNGVSDKDGYDGQADAEDGLLETLLYSAEAVGLPAASDSEGAGGQGSDGAPRGEDANANNRDAENLDAENRATETDGAEAGGAKDGGGEPDGSEEAPDSSGDDTDEIEEEIDPFDRGNFISAGAILAAMSEYEYEYIDEMDDSIFNTGENQFFFLMNYKKDANDWVIVRIVQKL